MESKKTNERKSIKMSNGNAIQKKLGAKQLDPKESMISACFELRETIWTTDGDRKIFSTKYFYGTLLELRGAAIEAYKFKTKMIAESANVEVEYSVALFIDGKVL